MQESRFLPWDQSKSSTVELTVTDVAGNRTVCDPVIAKVRGGKRGRLDSGERQKLDIAKYLRPDRRNTVVVRSRGGNDARVVISD